MSQPPPSETPLPSLAPSSDRRKYVIALAAIVGLGLFGLGGLKGSMAAYEMDFGKVRGDSTRVFQVPGVVDKSYDQRYNRTAGTFEFAINDVATKSQQLVVRSREVKPANFDAASQVVCIGSFKDGVFEARQILVKCPSKELDKMKGAGSPS